ncbi:TonB-dependent siderophore receptor [Massilia violaceinigra]|uniref:TonB-dependent siderophore receptor n=1 Tax=Massilia violaceinigra TaxID=2045208 RepID=A0ABY4A4A2_9BURK|nr:TonB-dependent siderophore receptor [Massilia violaceinigra]UOD29582.1 TonB-dependent siderophore receptor [Massilia violaceinigra]
MRSRNKAQHPSITPLARTRFTQRALLVAISHALATGLAATAAMPGAALAADATPARKAYAIPAGPLEGALNRFGREAGILLSFPTATTAGLQSAGLNGNYSVNDGLAVLLQGSNLTAVAQANGGYVLVRQAPAPSAATAAAAAPARTQALSEITVTARAEGDSPSAPLAGYVAKNSSTASKTATATREMPQSISVVTRDNLDARGVSNLAEALEYVPGFTPRTYGRDDRYDWSIARGIGSTNGGNYRDGLKDAGNVYAMPRLNSYGVERVEFLRGPASLLFGSAIPGGTVNSITKRPTAEAQGEIRVRAGDIARRGVAGDISGPLNADGSLLYRLVGLTEQYDLMTPGSTKKERYFAPSLTWKINGDSSLTVLANYQEDRIAGDAYPFKYVEALGYYVPVAEKGWDHFHRDQWSTGVLFDHRINDKLSFHSRSRYGKVKLDYQVNFLTGLISKSVVTRRGQHINDDTESRQTDNYMEYQWNAGKWSNTSIAGVDLSKISGASFRGTTATNPFDLSTGSGAFAAPLLKAEYVATTRQTGLYVQNQAKYDGQFVIVAGLRQDRFRENAVAAWVDGPVNTNKTTGRVGGVWLLPNGVSPYAGYATSFEPQNGATYDGHKFKPTSGRQYEVGVRYEPAGSNAMISAAVFDIVQQNVAASDPLHEGFNVQRGEVGSRGIELEANASLAQGIDTTASYSYTDARVTQDTKPNLIGRKNGLVPSHKAALWVNARLPGAWVPGMKVGMGVRYNSKVPDFENVRWVPGVTLFDARLGYQIGTHWELSLNARNLFDKKHLGNCSDGDCYPGDRREVLATANYRW